MATTPPLSQAPQPRMVDHALEYAAHGIPVFPLHHPLPDGTCSCRKSTCVSNIGKHPRTKSGFLDATIDAKQIRAWWKQWPLANIGVPTGKASGWVVLDVDPRNHGDTSLDALLAKHGSANWPHGRDEAWSAFTGGGGRHYLFAYPTRDVKTWHKGIAEGLDIKADGGYIVVSPSLHPSSNRYEWCGDILNRRDIPRMPEWLLDLAERYEYTPRQEPVSIRKPAADIRDDRDAYWLAWALTQAPGHSDDFGFQLAQQLLLDPNVRDIDGTLAAYARQATFDSSNPFTERDIDRWLKSAQNSNMVRGGEKAKNPNPNPQPARPQLYAVPSTDETDEGADETASIDALLLKGEPDDNGNAEAMYRLFGQEYLYTPAYGWLAWTGTHWRHVPEEILAQSVITTLKRRRHAAVDARDEAMVKATKASSQNIFGCLKVFKSYVIEPNVGVFDADPDMLNCLNGVLHMPTGKITPHCSKQRYTYCLPVEYDPSADKEPWRDFILDALGRDESAAAYLQLCVGYSLTGHTQEEKMFYLFGPPRAGKGTVTETLLDLLPRPLSTEADFSSFTAQRDNDSQNFDLAELKPARIVIASESNKHQSLNPAKIKTLTGGNHIRCAFKHKDMFTYQPQFKVWLVSNHKVTADADDEALWGRVQVFTFPHSHLGAEDVTLKSRMKTASNLQGVLRWAVEGAMAWYKQGRLTPPESVVEATREHRDKQDYIKQWIGDSCTLREDAWTTSAALTKSYQEWCEANGVKPMRATDFAETLGKRFNCTPRRQAGTGTRGYKGIAMGVTPVTEV